jgi:hypothetical protein
MFPLALRLLDDAETFCSENTFRLQAPRSSVQFSEEYVMYTGEGMSVHLALQPA